MSNETLHIDQLLNNSFAGFTPALPAMAWEGIAAKLDKNTKKRGIIWWQAAAVALIVSGTWFTVNQLTKKSDDTVSTLKTTPAFIQPDSKSSSNSDQTEKSGVNGNENSGLNNNSQNNGQFSPAPYKNANTHGSNANQHQKPDGVQNANQNVANPNGNPEIETKGTEVKVANSTVVNNVIANKAFDIRQTQITDEEWATLLKEETNPNSSISAVKTVKALPVRPFVALGGHFMFGLGVGQVVSNTGYSINSKYSKYVHPFFKENIKQGEGLLSSVSFNAALAYRVSKSKISIITGLSFFQRRNSQDFNFTRFSAGLEDQRPNQKLDKGGYFPWGQHIGPYNTVIGHVNYKGTSIFSQIEVPLGIMYEYKVGRTSWSIIPTLSGNLGFITEKSGKTLDYHNDTVMAIRPDWFRKNYFSINGTLGIYKNFNYSMKIGVSASGNYMLTPMYLSGATIRPRAFTGGLSTQLIWRID